VKCPSKASFHSGILAPQPSVRQVRQLLRSLARRYMKKEVERLRGEVTALLTEAEQTDAVAGSGSPLSLAMSWSICLSSSGPWPERD
jgi:hypothetical protein